MEASIKVSGNIIMNIPLDVSIWKKVRGIGYEVFKGKEMHSHNSSDWRVKWEYPEGIEEKILDDETYFVSYGHDSWDYDGGLMGSDAGELFIPTYIEVAPTEIKTAIIMIEKARNIYDKIFDGLKQKAIANNDRVIKYEN